jgi:hypothetical protein
VKPESVKNATPYISVVCIFGLFSSGHAKILDMAVNLNINLNFIGLVVINVLYLLAFVIALVYMHILSKSSQGSIRITKQDETDEVHKTSNLGQELDPNNVSTVIIGAEVSDDESVGCGSFGTRFESGAGAFTMKFSEQTRAASK